MGNVSSGSKGLAFEISLLRWPLSDAELSSVGASRQVPWAVPVQIPARGPTRCLWRLRGSVTVALPPQSSALTDLAPRRQNLYRTLGRSAGRWCERPALLPPGRRLWSRYHTAHCCVTNKTLDLQQTEGVRGLYVGARRLKDDENQNHQRSKVWFLGAAPAAALWSDADTTGPAGGTHRLRTGLGVLTPLSTATPDGTPNSSSSLECNPRSDVSPETGRAREAARTAPS